MAWLIGVGGIQAQYPTQLPFQQRNPYLKKRPSEDLIGDAIQAARSRGLRLLARMDFSKVPAEIAAEHPEWLFVSPSGQSQTHTDGLVSVCPSGEWYQERLFDIVDEVTTLYPLDGFFFNWFSMNEIDYFKRYHGVCHCGACQARWKTDWKDLDLPTGPADPTYPQWLTFSKGIIDDITSRVVALISRKLPQAGLILGQAADIMFHEANNAIGRELWHEATSEWVSASKAYRPDVPVLVNSVVFMDMPYRLASEEPDHFAQYIVQAMSRGGNPSTYIMGVPGKIPYTALNVSQDLMTFYKEHRAYYDGMKPCASIALVRPDRSQISNALFIDATTEFRGLYLAMQETHVFFDVIPQEHLKDMADSRGLSRYHTIILPHLGSMLAADAFVLDKWVQDGGSLIATGSSGIDQNQHSIQLRCLPSEECTGVMTDREQLFSTYISNPQALAQKHVYEGRIAPIFGALYSHRYAANCSSKYVILGAAPFAPPEKAYGNVETGQPGVVQRPYGAGTGVLVPTTIGTAYREIGLTAIRDVIFQVLDGVSESASRAQPLKVIIAEQVAVTINSQGPRTIIHLVNISGARRKNFGPYISIPGGLIIGADSYMAATALRTRVELQVNNGVIKLPRLDLFEVVVLERKR
jgi:hypothetical protein